MVGDEALVMTSLVLIMALFLLDPGCDILSIELLSLLPSGLVAGDTCGRCGINCSGD